MEYQKDILALVYVGTPLCTNSFLSSQAQAEGYYWILCGFTRLKFKKYLKIRISNWYSGTCICKYWPIPMQFFWVPKAKPRANIQLLVWKYIKFKQCLKIGILNSYFITCIYRYWPVPMSIFESPRWSQRLSPISPWY